MLVDWHCGGSLGQAVLSKLCNTIINLCHICELLKSQRHVATLSSDCTHLCEEPKACFSISNCITSVSYWRAKGMLPPAPWQMKDSPKLPAFIATSLLCARRKAMLSWYRWSHKQFAHYSDAEWCECQELVKFNVLSAARDSSAWAWLSWMLWLQQWPGAWCRVRQKSVAFAAETAEVLKLC